MVPLPVVLGLSIAISLALSAMLAIAWVSFGHPRHAASWSVAHLLVAVQIAAGGLLTTGLGAPVPLRFVVALSALGAGALRLIGVRQRAGDRRWRDVATIAIGAKLVILVLAFQDHRALEIALPGLVGALFTMAGALVLMRRPRTMMAAERTYTAALVLLAATKLFAALAAASLAAWPWWPAGRIGYAVAFAIGIPFGTIVAGIASVLLIASDLAEDLRRLAAFDPLTDVHNRRGFTDAAHRAIAVAQRRGAPVAVALADVDGFKAINDAHGHGAGDATLVAVARHLTAGVRNGDIVARLGGDEFALLLIDLDTDAALDAVERIRARLPAAIRDDGSGIEATMSFGVAAIGGGARSATALLAAALDDADRALYRAKSDGRDRAVLVHPDGD